MALTDKLTAIANAIRGKTNTTSTMTLGEMPTKIASIETVRPPYIKEEYNIYTGNFTEAKVVGAKSLREYLFFNCIWLEKVELPKDITAIGSNGFSYCTSLTMQSLPATITEIGNYAFYNCKMLGLTELPNALFAIGERAFSSSGVQIKEIPVGVTKIPSGAFSFCKGLTTITFKGTPNSIATDAFQECTNLTTINVPWAEGAVANAPWGATNATINYNYTGG